MSSHQRGIVALVVLLTLIGIAAVRRGRVRAVLGVPPMVQAGAISGTLEFGGLTREYRIHPPRGHSAGPPVPLVFVLHGATESKASVEEL